MSNAKCLMQNVNCLMLTPNVCKPHVISSKMSVSQIAVGQNAVSQTVSDLKTFNKKGSTSGQCHRTYPSPTRVKRLPGALLKGRLLTLPDPQTFD
jgi:hypothetical protein